MAHFDLTISCCVEKSCHKIVVRCFILQLGVYVEKLVPEDQREMKVSEAQAQCGRNDCVHCVLAA